MTRVSDAGGRDRLRRRAAATTAYGPLVGAGADITAWPVTEKARVKASPSDFGTGAPAEVRLTSSGTTGTPMPWYRTRAEHRDNSRAVAAAWAGLLGDVSRVVSVLDHNATAAGLLVEAVAELNEWILWRGFPYRIAGPRMDLLASGFEEFMPEVVVATPSGLIDIEESWRSQGVFRTRSASVKAMLLLGAPATSGMRNRLEKAWGARAFIASFGSTELGTIACGCAEGELHVLEGRHLLEVRTDDDLQILGAGLEGELIVTPLVSEATQLVRYATGDTVKCFDCVCGSRGRAIAIGGRDDDFVVVGDAAFGPEEVEHVIFTEGEAGDYMLEIDGDDRIVGVKVMPLGDDPIAVARISSGLQAPAVRVAELPALARAGGAAKSWKMTRTVRRYQSIAS